MYDPFDDSFRKMQQDQYDQTARAIEASNREMERQRALAMAQQARWLYTCTGLGYSDIGFWESKARVNM